MTRLIKTVLFDLNNVAEEYTNFEARLPDVLEETYLLLGKRFGLESGLDEFRAKASEIEKMFGSVPFHHHPGFWRILLEEVLGKNLAFAEAAVAYSCYLEAYERWIGIYADFAPAVACCSQQGLQTGIVANGNEERIFRFLEKHDLHSAVDFVIASGSIPFSKPQREIFQLAERRFLCAPHEVVFIGDRLDNDIRGANRYGCWSARLLRGPSRARRPSTEEEIPDIVLESLERLIDQPIFRLSENVADVVIPCGGRGTRLGEISIDNQKCTLPLEGRSVLGELVNLFMRRGIRRFHLLLGHRADQVKELVSESAVPLDSIRFHETHSPSTGQALLRVFDALPAAFLYCHGNVIFPERLAVKVFKNYLRHPGQSVLVITRSPQARSHPVFQDIGGSSPFAVRSAVGENADMAYSLGFGVIRKADLCAPDAKRDDLTVEELLDTGARGVRFLEYAGPWFHLATPDDMRRGVPDLLNWE